MLEVANLTVAYGPHRALEDVSIHVGRGEICVILGANGAGKSTLLKAIAGMVGVTPGARIANDRKDITGLKPHRIVGAGVALVPEGRGIFGDLTVAENLQLGAYGAQARAGEKARLEQVLKLFPKLGERRSQIARTMSGGEQQMVAIGRALMSNPAILMLDEPSLGLSPLLTKDLFKSLRAVRETGVGILLVEQNAKQSLAIADRGYLLENGHIVGEDRAEALARDPAVQAAYLGGAAAHAPAARPKAAAPPLPMSTNIDSAGEKAGGMAEALARRAAQIQRNYVTHRRQAAAPAGMNGHAHGLVDYHIASGEKIYMSEQAQELSRRAGDLAAHAKKVQQAHLTAMRAGADRSEAGRAQAPATETRQAASADPGASSGGTADLASFAKRVSRAHDAAMEAGAARATKAAETSGATDSKPAEPAKAEPSAEAAKPARPVQNLAGFARKVSAAHDAAMRAGAARAEKAPATKEPKDHAASETKTDPKEGTHDSAPAIANQLSRQAAELARHAMQVQSEHLAETRARNARAWPQADPSSPADVRSLSDDDKDGKKKAKKKKKKALKKALRKLKKQLKKLEKADD